MNRGSDVFATLAWGLKRYALIVVTFVVAIGVLVPFALSQRSPTYEARAQVGPDQKFELPNLDSVPRVAEIVFNNGAVEQDVRALLNQRTGNIVPSHVRLIAAQDNFVLEVVGRAKDPQTAIAIANEAATTFQRELIKYDKVSAPFVIQHAAVQAKKVPKIGGGVLSIALGLVAGVVAGVGLVALLLVMRRPVVDSAAAEDATGVPVFGRVSLTKGGGDLAPKDLTGIGLLCRRLLTTNPKVVYLAGPNPNRLKQLGGAMAAFMQQVSDAREHNSHDDGGPDFRPTPGVVVLDGPSLELWARVPDDSSMTLLLVPEGISSRRLRHLSEEHFTGTPAGVVLCTMHRRGRRSKKQAASPGAPGLPSGSETIQVGKPRGGRPNGKQRSGNKPRAGSI